MQFIRKNPLVDEIDHLILRPAGSIMSFGTTIEFLLVSGEKKPLCQPKPTLQIVLF